MMFEDLSGTQPPLDTYHGYSSRDVMSSMFRLQSTHTREAFKVLNTPPRVTQQHLHLMYHKIGTNVRFFFHPRRNNKNTGAALRMDR